MIHQDQTLNIDFANDPHSRGAHPSAVIAVAIALVLLLATWYVESTADARIRLLAKQLVQEQSTQETKSVSADSIAQLERNNSLTKQLSTPWFGLFQALESAVRSEVSVLKVESTREQGGIRIEGVTTQVPALTGYVQALRSAGLHQVDIVSHERRTRGQESLKFEISALWQIETPRVPTDRGAR